MDKKIEYISKFNYVYDLIVKASPSLSRNLLDTKAYDNLSNLIVDQIPVYAYKNHTLLLGVIIKTGNTLEKEVSIIGKKDAVVLFTDKGVLKRIGQRVFYREWKEIDLDYFYKEYGFYQNLHSKEESNYFIWNQFLLIVKELIALDKKDISAKDRFDGECNCEQNFINGKMTFTKDDEHRLEEEIIKNSVSSLDSKKQAFLNRVEQRVRNYIEKLSITDCLTLVIRDSKGNILSTWRPKEAMDGYIPRLIAFLRKKPYNGRQVDSYLTDKVVRIVTEEYDNFYLNNSEVFSKAVTEVLVKDSIFLNSLCSHIVERSNSTIPSFVRSKLTTLLIDKLKNEMGEELISTTAHGIADMTTQMVGALAAIPITKTIAMVLVKNIAFTMKGVIAKILASSAFKTMLAASIKKLVAVKILGAIIALVGAKLGIGGSGLTLGWVIAPLLIALIAHEVISLPKKLGEKISTEIRNELNGTYQSMNKNVVTQIVGGVFKSGISSFISDISEDPQMENLVSRMAQSYKSA